MNLLRRRDRRVSLDLQSPAKWTFDDEDVRGGAYRQQGHPRQARDDRNTDPGWWNHRDNRNPEASWGHGANNDWNLPPADGWVRGNARHGDPAGHWNRGSRDDESEYSYETIYPEPPPRIIPNVLLVYRDPPAIFVDFAHVDLHVYTPSYHPVAPHEFARPATHPAVHLLFIQSAVLRWGCKVSNPRFVTVGNVLDALHGLLHGLVKRNELEATPRTMLREVEEVWEQRTLATGDDEPRVKRVDYLFGRTVFAGLETTEHENLFTLKLAHPV